MATWIACTQKAGDIVHINFDNVTMLRRNDLEGGTRVIFVGGTVHDAQLIKETPNELLDIMGVVDRPRS